MSAVAGGQHWMVGMVGGSAGDRFVVRVEPTIYFIFVISRNGLVHYYATFTSLSSSLSPSSGSSEW